MSKTVAASDFWELSNSLPILDVRSPGEYRHGHILKATNAPLFDDEQRAEIGTLYKNQGRQMAVLAGLKSIGPRLPGLVSQAIEQAVDGRLLVHCWRGGMRSQSFSQILALADLKPIVLEGGYKSFRRFARGFFALPLKLVVVSGLTGAGKTRVLQSLEKSGEQVIDLERLANHRGSAFGGIGQGDQPTTEHFENCLFEVISRLDLNRNVWIEDEGNRVGSVVVPEVLYQRVRTSPAVCLECSFEQRMENLQEDYGELAPEQLVFAINKIKKRLDGKLAKDAVGSMEAGNVSAAIEIVLDYYDRTYRRAMVKMPREKTVPLGIDGLAAEEIVERMVAGVESLGVGVR